MKIKLTIGFLYCSMVLHCSCGHKVIVKENATVYKVDLGEFILPTKEWHITKAKKENVKKVYFVANNGHDVKQFQ